MSFVSSDNYSVLNNYSYSGKSAFVSTLDFLSGPLCKGLGGRNVCLLSLTYEEPLSLVARIALIAFSLLLTPIALIAATSLLLKAVFSPYIGEKKLIETEVQKTSELIEKFKEASRNDALKIIEKNPCLAKRSEIQDTLFNLIKQKIDENAPLTEIQPVMNSLKEDSADKLLSYAVYQRLTTNPTTRLADLDKLAEATFSSKTRRGLEKLHEYYQNCRMLLDILLLTSNQQTRFVHGFAAA